VAHPSRRCSAIPGDSLRADRARIGAAGADCALELGTSDVRPGARSSATRHLGPRTRRPRWISFDSSGSALPTAKRVAGALPSRPRHSRNGDRHADAAGRALESDRIRVGGFAGPIPRMCGGMVARVSHRQTYRADRYANCLAYRLPARCAADFDCRLGRP
jgi:hypothetical protein